MDARRLLAALACALPLVAVAQWQWKDAQGRQVFSDQPPPADVPGERILRRPGGRSTPPPAPAASMPAPAGRDPVLEQRRQAAAVAEAARLQAQREQQARQRADSCERARKARATLDSGVRLGLPNARGEIEVLDDAARARETERVQRVIEADCEARP